MRNDRTVNPDGTLRTANQTLYWVIGALVVLALVIFFAMRNSVAPTTPVESTGVSDTTTTSTTTTGVNAAGGLNNGTSMTAPVEGSGVYNNPNAADPALSNTNGATGDAGTGADASPTRQ